MRTYTVKYWTEVAGIEYRVTAEVIPGTPERGPSYSHGGLPADPPEVQSIALTAPDGTDASHLLTDELYEALAYEAMEREADDDGCRW